LPWPWNGSLSSGLSCLKSPRLFPGLRWRNVRSLPLESNMREPLRTCIGCRQVRPKRALVRLVVIDGQLLVDPSGGVPGRGAYCCRVESCMDEVLRRDRLARAFRTSVNVSKVALARLRTSLLNEARSLGITAAQRG